MNEFTRYLIHTTARAYAAFIISMAIVAGVFTGVRLLGVVHPRAQDATVQADFDRVNIAENE